MSEQSHIPAPHQVTVEVGGRPLILETGKVAKQANGAILARYGDTIVLTTACMATTKNDRDFLPLTVDYRENTYSAGKIPGGFFKREGRPSEKEVLTSRLIDRPMRPLFPDSWRNETQIVSMVLSADSDNDPDVIAVTGASAACYCSDLPFEKPIAAVRVGLLDGQLVANPTVADQKKSLMNIVIAGHGRRHRDGGVRRAGSFRRNGGRRAGIWPRADQENRGGHQRAARAIEAEESGGCLRCRSTRRSTRKLTRNTARDCTMPWIPRSIPRKKATC